MRKFMLIAATLVCWPISASAQETTPAPAATAPAAPANDATKFITGIIDKFNGGDVKAWVVRSSGRHANRRRIRAPRMVRRRVGEALA